MANISYKVNIIPKTNNTYTLGNSDYKWSNIYAVQINGINVSSLATNTNATTSAAGLMSAADKTKLNALDAREWELIREDTFTNTEEADHTITVDGNGNAFDLTDVLMLFETPRSSTIASAKGSYGQIWFYYGTGSSDYFASESGAWTQAVDTSSHGFAVKITQEPGGLFTCMETAQTTSTNSAAWRSRYVGGFTGSGQGIKRLTEIRHITKIKIRTVTGLGHYILMGKRALS